MGFVAFITPAVQVLAWTVWGLAIFIVVNAVVVQSFRLACKAYHEYKLAFFQALHKQSQEDAEEVRSQIWQEMR